MMIVCLHHISNGLRVISRGSAACSMHPHRGDVLLLAPGIRHAFFRLVAASLVTLPNAPPPSPPAASVAAAAAAATRPGPAATHILRGSADVAQAS